jgi:hypothetical protein
MRASILALFSCFDCQFRNRAGSTFRIPRRRISLRRGSRTEFATGTKTGTRRSAEIPESRKSLILLVGGAGFEPATLGL